MADIELVIKIPEGIYQHYRKIWQKRRGSIPESCIAFGTPLPKGHGKLIDADELIKEVGKLPKEPNGHSKVYDEARIIMMIDAASTIIKADKEREENENECQTM